MVSFHLAFSESQDSEPEFRTGINTCVYTKKKKKKKVYITMTAVTNISNGYITCFPSVMLVPGLQC